MPPLLLHSIATFDDIIDRALDTVEARRVAEIGAEGAEFSGRLAEWAERVDGHVVCVDPHPSDRLTVLAREHPRVELVEEFSPGVLTQLEPCDVYVLDGDHNYATVGGELRALADRLLDRERPSLVILHDVGWPCARRDQYYAPSRLPEGDRHPYTFEGGIIPGERGVVQSGFHGAGNFAVACEEGGERNGVLTAVDDFIEEVVDLRFYRIPVVFGLGFLFAEAAPWADELRTLLEPLHDRPLLRTLERNRLDLYVRVIELQDELEAERMRHAEVVGRLQEQLHQLRRAQPGL